MSKIAIYYGPENGSVNRVAEKIRQKLGPERVEMKLVKNASVNDFKSFEKIIFGISTVGKETWDAKATGGDWAKFLPEISNGEFSGVTVAIFGLGNHVNYASNFVDFMGLLANELMKTDANIVGQVSTDGYEFEESAAIFNDEFIGLPLDEDFEPELTDQRVEKWVTMLSEKHGF